MKERKINSLERLYGRGEIGQPCLRPLGTGTQLVQSGYTLTMKYCLGLRLGAGASACNSNQHICGLAK